MGRRAQINDQMPAGTGDKTDCQTTVPCIQRLYTYRQHTSRCIQIAIFSILCIQIDNLVIFCIQFKIIQKEDFSVFESKPAHGGQWTSGANGPWGQMGLRDEN